MRKSNQILATISMLALSISILIGIIFCMSFNHTFYAYEYSKNKQAEIIGMSDTDLMKATDTLLDYLNGSRDDIVVEATIYGEKREVFNDRETKHMVDVKALCDHAKYAGISLFVVSILSMMYLYMKDKKHVFQTYAYGFKTSMILLAIFVSFLAMYAFVDFYNFWMNFHYLFFDNDLFILDPNTSIMINMFPESFFFDLVMLIIVSYIVVMTALYFMTSYLSRKESV